MCHTFHIQYRYQYVYSTVHYRYSTRYRYSVSLPTSTDSTTNFWNAVQTSSGCWEVLYTSRQANHLVRVRRRADFQPRSTTCSFSFKFYSTSATGNTKVDTIVGWCDLIKLALLPYITTPNSYLSGSSVAYRVYFVWYYELKLSWNCLRDWILLSFGPSGIPVEGNDVIAYWEKPRKKSLARVSYANSNATSKGSQEA